MGDWNVTTGHLLFAVNFTHCTHTQTHTHTHTHTAISHPSHIAKPLLASNVPQLQSDGGVIVPLENLQSKVDSNLWLGVKGSGLR